MATLVAPFNESMKLGSGESGCFDRRVIVLIILGFNSFTQQLCVDHAVIPGEPAVKADNADVESTKDIPQSVTYKTSVINKVSDVTKNLQVGSASYRQGV